MRLVVVRLAACASQPRPAPVPAPCTPERIGSVTVAGAPRTLVPALAVLEGTLDDRERTARILQVATEALRWRGYAQARIVLARRTGCFVDLHADVTLGPRFRIARIAFATDDDFPRARRLATLEDALGTVNTVGGVLIEYRLRRALAVLAERYREAGWLDVDVGAPALRYEDAEVHVTIPITAGPRYRVGAIRARGGTAIARARLLDALGIEPGAYYDASAVRRALVRARRSLDRRVQLRANAVEAGALVDLEAVLR